MTTLLTHRVYVAIGKVIFKTIGWYRNTTGNAVVQSTTSSLSLHPFYLRILAALSQRDPISCFGCKIVVLTLHPAWPICQGENEQYPSGQILIRDKQGWTWARMSTREGPIPDKLVFPQSQGGQMVVGCWSRCCCSCLSCEIIRMKQLSFL